MWGNSWIRWRKIMILLFYQTIAGNSFLFQLSSSDLITPAAAIQGAMIDSFDCPATYLCALWALDRTDAKNYLLVWDQALLIAAGNRREYSVEWWVGCISAITGNIHQSIDTKLIASLCVPWQSEKVRKMTLMFKQLYSEVKLAWLRLIGCKVGNYDIYSTLVESYKLYQYDIVPTNNIAANA